ncbi:MAG: hypothetical protein CVV25_07835 [Ignavibacteriae bacterium HGW-Ignavibacteriae-4]|jgi:hypothetical protein|nr:MAG: hypothetical protein CVV25_07835 [Ignavibacteriae bacterium HGW-Ignavibacteriae-4]
MKYRSHKLENSLNIKDMNLFEKFTVALTVLLLVTSFLLHNLDFEFTQQALHGIIVSEIVAYLTVFCIICSLIIVIKSNFLGFSLLFFNIMIFMSMVIYAYIGE